MTTYIKYFIAGFVTTVIGYLLLDRNKYKKKSSELAIKQHTKLFEQAQFAEEKAKKRITKNQEKLRDLQVDYFNKYDSYYTYKGKVPGIDRRTVETMPASSRKGK